VSVFWLVVGCPRPQPVKAPRAPPRPVAAAPIRVPVTGPTYWSEAGGLCLEVPQGYRGTTGPPPDLLELSKGDTGFELEIHVFPPGDPPAERPGFELLFEDRGGYRTIPILGEGSASRSWISVDPDGPMAQSWFGPLGDRTVEVVLVYPHGRAIEGEDALAPIVASLCTTWR
jgi:hypothetical protein